MDRPAAAGFDEAEMTGRMPIARHVHWHVTVSGRGNPAIQHRNDFVAPFDRKRAARTKVSLHVDDDQGISALERATRVGHGTLIMVGYSAYGYVTGRSASSSVSSVSASFMLSLR